MPTIIINGRRISLPFPVFDDRAGLRVWWHNLLREEGQYSCYAIFLFFPSSKNAIRYLTEFGKEIDAITGDNCLVIALGSSQFKRSGIDDHVWMIFDDFMWQNAVNEQADQGYSAIIAKLFKIRFDEFPCVLVFKDIRSPDRALISLKDMNEDEIAQRMRTICSIIQEAALNGNNPVEALNKN